MKRHPLGFYIEADHWTAYLLALHVTWMRHHKGNGWPPWWEFTRGTRKQWLLRIRRLAIWWSPAKNLTTHNRH